MKTKTLLLLRHAKSSWDDPGLEDHDRPLAGRGRKAAPLMGKYLRESGISPDAVFSSTAKRARQTVKRCLKEMEADLEPVFDEDLYHDGENTVLRILETLPDPVNTVMFVGHNPDMARLVERLTGKEFPYPKFPTAGLAVIEFRRTAWKGIRKSAGRLVHFRTPRTLGSVNRDRGRE